MDEYAGGEHPTEQGAEQESGHGAIVEAGTIVFRRVLPGPIERVWAYLTEPEKRGRWFASGPMELRAGGDLTLVFQHAKLTPYDETPPECYRAETDSAAFEGRVTRCEPPRLLAFTWECVGPDSEVTFELTPRDDGRVLLLLTHRRLSNRSAMVEVGSGWHVHLAILEAVLTGRQPPRFWATHTQLYSDYEQRVPAD